MLYFCLILLIIIICVWHDKYLELKYGPCWGLENGYKLLGFVTFYVLAIGLSIFLIFGEIDCGTQNVVNFHSSLIECDISDYRKITNRDPRESQVLSTENGKIVVLFK